MIEGDNKDLGDWESEQEVKEKKSSLTQPHLTSGVLCPGYVIAGVKCRVCYRGYVLAGVFCPDTDFGICC